MMADLPDPCPETDPGPAPSVPFHGTLYRALNPIWARKPLSGDGARLHGGRFNPKGTAALYTAMSAVGAMDEANQAGRPFEPITLVSYQAQFDAILDATDARHRQALGIEVSVLSDPDWRMTMIGGHLAPSQQLALRLIDLGYAGMIVPSQAPGAAPGARNLVLWDWQDRLRVIDSEGRLSAKE